MNTNILKRAARGMLILIASMMGIASGSNPSRVEPHVMVRVVDAKGEPKSGIEVSAIYPTSSHLVTGVTDKQGMCSLKLRSHPTRAPISIYLRSDGSSVGQIVVAVPASGSEIHRDAIIGSYVEYNEEGKITRKHSQ